MNIHESSEPRHHLAATDRAGMGVGSLSLLPTDVQSVSGPNAVTANRPTVLHFIYGVAGGGAESMMRSLVRGLDRRSWRVVVVALQAKVWPDETEELRSTVDALHVLEETAFLSMATLKKLSAVMRAERPDVVQTWMHHADFAGGLVAKFSGVKKVVWGIHCREITRAPGESWIKSWLFARVMPLLAQWVPSRIVSCSRAALDDHEKMGYPKDKLKWIANGVDTQRFRPLASAREEMRFRLGVADDEAVIGFAGRLHEMKNLPLLLRAFGLLCARRSAVRLVLCGVQCDELDESSRAELASLSGREAIQWLPFQSDPELFYPALDVFTLTSRTEACPMTILEAMACGVLCVATDVGDCGRLIGETGVVVPSGDVEAVAAAWLEMLELPAQEKAQRGAAARERVVTSFSLERAAVRYQELYETLTHQVQS